MVETHGQDEEEAPTTTTSQESVTQFPKRKRRAVLLSKFHREMYIRVNHSNRGENNNNNNKQNPDCTRFSLNYIMDYCRSLSTSSSSIGAVALSLSTTCCLLRLANQSRARLLNTHVLYYEQLKSKPSLIREFYIINGLI